MTHEKSYQPRKPEQLPDVPAPIPLGSVEPAPLKTVQSANEEAYRRGYYEGYQKALEMLKIGCTTEQLRAFYTRQLKQWRYSDYQKRKDPPRWNG